MENKYFFCYSYKLKLFLKSLNVRYELSGNNNNTDKPYWVYLRSDELLVGLDKWKIKKNSP